jgi:hypothetical protein
MSRKATIRVGDHVRFQYGKYTVIGTITEDRGPIGMKGRNLYRIFCALEPEYSFEIELPAAEFEVVKPTVSPDKKS